MFLKKLDWYIIRRLFGTFFFTMFFLLLIVILLDVNQRQTRLSNNGSNSIEYLKHYSIYYMVYLGNTFVQLVVFISVIFFTSRLTNNTEIVAMHSGGMSFYRVSRPYIVSGLVIAATSLYVSHFLLPYSNVKKNTFYEKYLVGATQKSEFLRTKRVHAFISKDEQLNIIEYSQDSKSGSGFSYFKYDKKLNRTHSIQAQNAKWNEKKGEYELTNVVERWGGVNEKLPQHKDKISFYDDKIQFFPSKNVKLNANPDYLLPSESLAENLTTPKLIEFIKRRKEQADPNIKRYETYLYERTSLAVSTFIMTILALAISSRKRRGGIGMNLVIGIALAFLYVILYFILGATSKNGKLDPIIGTTLPNIIFALITLVAYFRRARM